MFHLLIVQAEHGDCFLLKYGKPDNPLFILVDGGPKDVYQDHLRSVLLNVRDAVGPGEGTLELVMVSHADTDHIIGLQDLLSELRQQRADGQPENIAIEKFWYNSFGKTVDPDGSIALRLNSFLASAGTAASVMGTTQNIVQGMKEGHKLRLDILSLGVPLNPGFADAVIMAESSPSQPGFGDLSMKVVGPTKANLEELRQEWLDWLDENEDEMVSGDFSVAANLDKSIKNISSIVVLVEGDNKKLLLTGDARSDHVLEGLEQAGLLNGIDKMHIDVLKVPHHGSDRNVTKTFFRKVAADYYVISANGRDDNPDFETLKMIVETAKEQDREIEIIVTNKTTSTDMLIQQFPKGDFGYELTIMNKGFHTYLLEIAS